MKERPCGCPWGACICGPIDMRTENEKRASSFNSDIASIQRNFNNVLNALDQVEKDVQKLKKEKELEWSPVLKKAHDEAAAIVKEAHSSAREIIKEARDMRNLKGELSSLIKKKHIPKRTLAWIIAISAELSLKELRDVIEEELQA